MSWEIHTNLVGETFLRGVWGVNFRRGQQLRRAIGIAPQPAIKYKSGKNKLRLNNKNKTKKNKSIKQL